MDFKSYQNTEPYTDYRMPKEAEIKNTINNLSKLNDDQLFSELSKQVAIKQKNGSIGDINRLFTTIQPFLNAEQKKRLDTVMKNIKV
jgi:hypothetical protein